MRVQLCTPQGKDTLHRNVRYAQKHRSSVGFRQQVSQPFGLQKTHPDEHAGGPGWQGAVHHHAVRAHPRKPEHKNAMRYVCALFIIHFV